MAYDYARAKATAERLIIQFGQDAALRQVTNAGPDWAPTQTPAYTTIKAADVRNSRSFAGGSLVMAENTDILTSPPASVVIAPGDKIALGLTADDADENSDWMVVSDTGPFAPDGTVIYYALVLQD